MNVDRRLQFEGEDLVLVAMIPEHAQAYQEWLLAQGLYLFRVPDDPDGFYAVGISKERWEGQGRFR